MSGKLEIPSQHFLNQIPGMFHGVDLDGHFMFSNDTASRWLGYSHAHDIVGTTYSQMKCDASEFCDQFTAQDRAVRTSGTADKVVGYFKYADGEQKLLVGLKKPFLDSCGAVVGVVGHFINYADSTFIDLNAVYQNIPPGAKSNQATFVIRDTYVPFKLTKRQTECLYFYIRSMTDKEMALKLGCSHRTVHAHVDNIKQKLGCDRRSQVVEKCYQAGFFNTIPEAVLASILRKK